VTVAEWPGEYIPLLLTGQMCFFFSDSVSLAYTYMYARQAYKLLFSIPYVVASPMYSSSRIAQARFPFAAEQE